MPNQWHVDNIISYIVSTCIRVRVEIVCSWYDAKAGKVVMKSYKISMSTDRRLHIDFINGLIDH